MPGRLNISRVAVATAVTVLLIGTAGHELPGDDRPPATRAALPVTRPAPDPNRVSDRDVHAAIARGAEFLLAQMKDGQVSQGSDVSPAFHEGLNALCVYALLSAGQATQDSRLMPTAPAIRRLMDQMKFHPMATDRDRPQSPVVYARSHRAAALSLYAAPDDIDALRDDVQWLVDASVQGAYSYDDRSSSRIIAADDKGGAGSRALVGRGTSGGSPVAVRPPTGGSPGLTNKPGGGSTSGPPAPPIRREQWVIIPPDIARRPPVVIHRVPYDVNAPRKPAGPAFRPPSTPTKKPTGGGGGGGLTIPPAPPPRFPPQELPDKNVQPFVWDNSNSQFGFFGVLCGADAGIEVPDTYFDEVQGHWLWCQLKTGEWPYRADRPVGYLAMTCAGIASLTAAHDRLQAPTVARLGHQPDAADDSLGAAFDWLTKGDNAVTVDGPRKVYVGYTLFTLGRVGLTTGYKYLGNHEWYPELAAKVVASQSPNGSWGKTESATSDTLIDTAYSVLFLARGRHPVMMNKLQLDPPGHAEHGEWNNRPRDLANLAAFTSRELERPVQWQIVPLDRDPADWSDAPILYLASHASLKLSDPEIAKLRAFIEAGGLLFTQADDGANAFNTYVDQQLAKRLYPDRELKDLPRDHQIYTLQYQIALAKRPRLRGMTDATGRLVWIHSPTDLAVAWQQRATYSKREVFEMGLNLFAFAAGKGDLRRRLEPRVLPPAPNTGTTLSIARVDTGSLSDPNPRAFPRFARYLYDETSLGLNIVNLQPAKLTEPGAPRVAHLYLPPDATLSPTDATALQQFVTAGGTLIVESPGATHPAAARPRTPVTGDHLGSPLGAAFPTATFEPVTESHPLVNATNPGMEKLWPLRLEPYVIKSIGADFPPTRIATVGQGKVIHLPLDITTGLLGSAQWGTLGYDPVTAQALLKNILLWTTTQ